MQLDHSLLTSGIYAESWSDWSETDCDFNCFMKNAHEGLRISQHLKCVSFAVSENMVLTVKPDAVMC